MREHLRINSLLWKWEFIELCRLKISNWLAAVIVA
nr:MAG TPA: hypothetical protein [Caudoviricetes sp.]